jgi:ABC-2 type transport system ATP-binding protein
VTDAIRTINLTKTYGARTAVRALNLSVARGETYALLGLNGAGKTTTIKMVTGLIRPTSGDAMVLGASVVAHPEAVKRVVNVSPQETAVARNLTVRENLDLIARLYGLGREAVAPAVAEMLATFGLDEVARDRARTLSGGMQRRLSIAMALITDPKVLFLDEPTLGLDVLARRELWATLRRLKGRVTIVLTSHSMEEATALADRVGVMAHGELRAVGTVAELQARTGQDNLEDAFVALVSEGAVAA